MKKLFYITYVVHLIEQKVPIPKGTKSLNFELIQTKSNESNMDIKRIVAASKQLSCRCRTSFQKQNLEPSKARGRGLSYRRQSGTFYRTSFFQFFIDAPAFSQSMEDPSVVTGMSHLEEATISIHQCEKFQKAVLVPYVDLSILKRLKKKNIGHVRSTIRNYKMLKAGVFC